MPVIYFFYSLLVTILTLSMSLIYVVTCWWFLILPKYKRFKLFYIIVMIPWTFVFNRLLLAMRIKLLGLENVDQKRTTLYICNHQSWVDIPVIFRYCRTTGISKKQVLFLPLIGQLIYYASVILVDRGDQKSRLHIVKVLIEVFRKGVSIVLFPEGTRSRDGRLLKPNNAVAKLCFKMNIPVVPIAIEGTNDILPRKRLYLKFLQRVVVKMNPPVIPKDFKDEEEFADACWNKVIESHESILKEYFPSKYEKMMIERSGPPAAGINL
jgi:1-acyl-sn-glycerol-3-phosphate acyltransferase